MNSSASPRLDPSRSFAARAALLLVFLAVVVGAMLAGASPAAAHDELVGSDPEAGATVDALPTQIVLTYSGDLIDEGDATEVVVTDADGNDLGSGDPVIDGRLVTKQLAGGDVLGTVVVQWRVVSSDGHPIAGEFVFGVGEAPVTPTAAPGPPMESTDLTWALYAGAAFALLLVIAVVVLVIRRSNRSG